MKIDQIAFYAFNSDQAELIKSNFGLQDKQWIQDTVTANSVVNNSPVSQVNIAELQFNYDLGIELEILRYVRGPRWHETNPLASTPKLVMGQWILPPFISHVGIHLEDGEPFPEMKHCRLVQETFTTSHTAKYLTDPDSPGFGRTYHYRIFEMSPGSYIKYIRRIHPPK